MADERLRTKSELKRLFTNLQGKSISDGMFSILIDVLWRDKVTQRGSGFEFPGSVDVLISFEEGTRTFTIKPFDLLLPDHDPRYGIYSFTHFATFHRMYGERTIQLPNEEGLYLIYFDAESYPGNAQILTFLKNPTKDQIQNIIQYKVSIASIYWDATANEALYFGNDKHGSEWNGPIHWYLHSTIGASRSSGLQFSNLEIGQNGSANSHAQFTVTGGVMLHDDFQLTIPGSSTSIPILYSFGTLPRFLTNAGYGIAKGASRIYFNSGQISLAECASGNYCLYHIFATNEILTTSRKTISVMGIDEYTTLADAHANVNIELDSVRTYMPQQGTCYIGTIIVQTDDTFTNSIKARIVSITGNETHPPVSIAPGSETVLSINDKQELAFDPTALGAIGEDGASAYEIAVINGFVGTEQEWLGSLAGSDGIDGDDATANFDVTDGTNSGTILNADTLAVKGSGSIGVIYNALLKTFTVSASGGEFIIIPNYYVINLAEFVAAYTDIRANYNGGNIYINGTIILTANLTLNMLGINCYATGYGGGFRFCNSTSSTAPVYRIIITQGNPTFTNISFSGSSSNYQNNLATWTTRWIFELTYTYGCKLTFENCTFSDIVCGIDNSVIRMTAPYVNYTSTTISFRQCRVSSHTGSGASSFEYAGFTISFTGSSFYAALNVIVFDAIATKGSTNAGAPLNNSDTKFNFAKGSYDFIRVSFFSDETVWINSIVGLGNFIRQGVIESSVEMVDPLAEDDFFLVQDTSDHQNIKKIAKADMDFGAHNPVTIHGDSSALATIDASQVLTIIPQSGSGGGLAEIAFEFCVEAGISTIHDIDIYCSAPYTIAKAILESDGTLNNVKIKISGTDITGLDAMTIAAIAVFTATASNDAIEADRITIVTSGTDSGTPTILKGKIVFA